MILLTHYMLVQQSIRSGQRREVRWLALVVGAFLKLLPEFVQDFGFLSTVQLLLQLLESDGNNVVVVCARKPWIGSHLEPQMMKQIEILIS